VTQLDQMTQQNAALVEQSAAAAESLKDQGSRLHVAVAKFQLQPKNGSYPGAASAGGGVGSADWETIRRQM
jgi:hypothetical protein